MLNVLQAIGSWGDAVSAEAQSLTAYNTQLANLERRTGTILETHGIRFYEERYQSIGPLGRLHPPASYPRSLNFQRDLDNYPATNQPAEESFDLTIPDLGKQLLEPIEPLER